MKTIFITAFRREQVKDVLLGGLRTVLEKDPSVKVVFLVPAYRVPECVRAFQGRAFTFEGVPDGSLSPPLLDAFFGKLARRYGALPPTIRRLCRFFDLYFVRASFLDDIFEAYRPNLVFASSANLASDQNVLRESKRRGVRTIGMISAWNMSVPSRFSLRLVPDEYVVWNEIAKDELLKREKDAVEHVFVSGVPRLDYHISHVPVSRDTFCQKLSIESSKRIVLFISVPHINKEEHRTLELLSEAVSSGALPRDVVFLVRNYPREETAKGSFLGGSAEYGPHIVFDNAPTFWGSGKTYIDGLREDVDHVADSLFHADAVVTSQDTMGIDARYFDKPVIELLDYRDRRGDLIRALKDSLDNPNRDKTGRRERSKSESANPDGNAGGRIATFMQSAE